jgi:hypothetical protein
MIHATIEVYGIKEALRELNTIDKKARRKVTTDFKRITDPIVNDAVRKLPSGKPPISGWGRNWKTKSGQQMLPWDTSIGANLIKAKVSGKKPREWAGHMSNLATFIISWSGAINTVYDMAGRKSSGKTDSGKNMINGLEARFGKASRVLWPAYEMNRQEVEKQMRLLLEDVMNQVNRNLVIR